MEVSSTGIASPASSTDFYKSSESESDSKTLELQNGLAGNKRKLEVEAQPGNEKRPKIASDVEVQEEHVAPSCAGLPAELWQQVFLYVSPRTLGRLIQVNRAFNEYLTKIELSKYRDSTIGCLKLRGSDFIWASARKTFHSQLPRPLSGLSELATWKLILGKECQMCGKKARKQAIAENVWEQGPGPDGVRIIWPFGIRCCGRCLESSSEKESTLLFSTVSVLLPALPFAFVHSDLNYIPASVIKDSSGIPPNIAPPVKLFYKQHVEDIQRDLEEARALGPAAATEWYKGLENAGREKLDDANRWERWETKGRPGVFSPLPSPSDHNFVRTSPVGAIQNCISFPTPPSLRQEEDGASEQTHTLLPQPTVTPQSGMAFAPPPHLPPGLTQLPQSAHVPRAERSLRDVNEAKTARKRDIERRCQEFDPPIPPNVLRHIESFQAAIQIPTVMTDEQWEILKPRLLANVENAERIEQERTAHVASLQVKLQDRRQLDANSKETKEALDREWEELQNPVRERLSLYADELIDSEWASGQSVTPDNSAIFAANILLHVRRRFYEDLAKEAGGQTENEPRQNQESLTLQPTRKLLLDHMKWVFDNKVKPLTEQHRKELFLCRICEGLSKFYGFEGVIQHFGAKHTNAFSVGNIVVHWRESEWPEEPPFHPNPSAVTLVPKPPVSGMNFPNQPSFPPYQYGGYSRGATSTPLMASQPHGLPPQMSPGPYAQSQYPQHGQGPFPPPPMAPVSYPAPAPGYPAPQTYGQPAPGYPYQQPGYHNAPSGYSSNGSYQMQQPAMFGAPYTGQPYQAHPGFHGSGWYPPPANSFGPAPDASPTNQPVLPVPPTEPSLVNQAAPVPEEPQFDEEQVNDLANTSRSLWTRTSGVKGLAQSVRVHVVIHHTISAFISLFTHEPSLDLFADALANHPSMKPLKTANGLACAVCENARHYHRRPQSSRSSRKYVERKTFNLLSLVNHFRSAHHSPRGPNDGSRRRNIPPKDWTEDMIDLPDDRSIAELANNPDLDDDKLQLISETFPSQFRSVQGSLPQSAPISRPGSAAFVHNGGTAGSSRATSGTPANFECSGLSSPRSFPPVREDEYDPRRPALMPQDVHQPRPSRASFSPPYRSHGMREYEPEEGYYYVPREVYERDAAGLDGLHYPRSGQIDIEQASFAPRECREASKAVRTQEPAYSAGSILSGAPPGYREVAVQRPYAAQQGPRADSTRMDRSARTRQEERAEGQGAPPPMNEAERAAEQFLRNFQPDEAIEDYQRKSQIHEPEENGPSIVTENGAPEAPPPSRAMTDSQDLATLGPSRPQPGEILATHTSVSGPPPGEPYVNRRIYHEEIDSPGRRYHGRERYYEHVPRRYARYMRVCREESHPVGERMARSHSRFERYEHERRRLDRERSRSPSHRDEPTPEVQMYRDRSIDVVPYAAEPQMVYRSRQDQHSPREYIPIDDPGLRYSSGPQVVYRYADPTPRQYVNEYGKPVQYVPVREAYPPPRYVQGRPGVEPQLVQYVPYERGMPRRREVYEEPQYVIYADRHEAEYEPPPAGAAAPGSERQGYEPAPEASTAPEEQRGPTIPREEVRYVEQPR